MHKRLVMILIGTVALIIGALSFWMPAPNAAPAQHDLPQQRIAPPTAVVYSAVFHHILAIKEQAEEAESLGKDSSSLRAMFRDKANLTDAQARDLDRIAAGCVNDVALQDARAQQIINDFQLRFPPGKLPRGVKLPPPPPELTQMQEERDAMILQARTSLRVALGEDGFQRFDELVAGQVASNMKPVPLHLTAARPLPAPLTTGGGTK